MNQADPAFSENLRRQLSRCDDDSRLCSHCDEAITSDRDEDGEPVCEDCAVAS